MASLTLVVGNVTAAVEADNTKAAAVLNAYADAIGATGSNQQRASAVVQALVRHMQEQGQRHTRNAAINTAVAAAQGEIDAIDWA